MTGNPIVATAATRLLLLLGEPVSHSRSPVMQNAAIRHGGHDAFYGVLRCDVHSVAPLMRALCRAGAGGNVTVPHKAVAAECVERPTAAVLRTGACNTFWGEDGQICGDNTDVAGFSHAACLLLSTLRDTDTLIIGAGGAAAAASCALLDAGARSVTLLNRSPDRARTLAARLDRSRELMQVVTSVGDVADRDYDLVVNASALGLHSGDPLPFDLATLGQVRAALDVVYTASQTTPWVKHARRLGIAAADGTEMLIGQGAAAYERWFGQAPDLDVMRAALNA